MANANPTSDQRRIVLSRDQRDALHAIVADELPHIFGDESRDLDDVLDRRNLSRPFFELLDQIGWQPDATRERYDLALDTDWLRAFLERRRDDAGQVVDDEQRALIGTLAGDAAYLIDGGTFADTEAQAGRNFVAGLVEIGRIDIVLAALDAAANR